MLLAMPLASCATMTVGSGDNVLPEQLKQPPFCSVAKGISWSSSDTAETVVEIKEHNAVGAILCGWKAR